MPLFIIYLVNLQMFVMLVYKHLQVGSDRFMCYVNGAILNFVTLRTYHVIGAFHCQKEKRLKEGNFAVTHVLWTFLASDPTLSA